MKHLLPELPYELDALAPAISPETLQFHHGKHHKNYVDKLNQLIAGTEYEEMPLEEILRRAPEGRLFNNAAQAWNHSFYWQCLTPKKLTPHGHLLKAIERDFGSVDDFLSKFRQEAKDLFGSGWVWLVQHEVDGRLSIMSTSNADTPVRIRLRPLLTWDVWEHAYYIDYRNERALYLEEIASIVDWSFVAKNFSHSERAAA